MRVITNRVLANFSLTRNFRHIWFVDMSDMFLEVSLIMWESLMILAMLGQKLWDQTSFGLKTVRSKNIHVGQFLTQKQA